MGLKARGTILESLDNSEANGDEDAETQSNSEDGGDSVLSPKQASNARDTHALSKRWWDESRPRRRGAIRPAPESSCNNFLALFDGWLQARGLEDALEHEDDKDGFAIYRYTRVPLTSEQEGWDRAFHGTRLYALWLILASGVLLESDDREAGHDFWEPGVYCSPLMTTARWYARPHILFGDGIYHRALLELAVDTKRRKRERMRGGVQWVFPTDAVAIRSVWLEKNAPPSVEEQRFTSWDSELEALPPGWTAPEPVKNEFAGLLHNDVDLEESGDTQPETEMQDEGPLQACLHQQLRQCGLSAYVRLKMKVPSKNPEVPSKASVMVGSGRQPMQPSATQAQPTQRMQPPLAQCTQSQDAIVRLKPPQRPIVRLQSSEAQPMQPQCATVRLMRSRPKVSAAPKDGASASWERVAATPAAPCVTSKTGGILKATGIGCKALPAAPKFSGIVSTKLHMAEPKPFVTSPPVVQATRPFVSVSAGKATKKPVDELTAACDGIEQDLAAFMGELGEDSGAIHAKRQKTWQDELLEDIARKKQELLQKKT